LIETDPVRNLRKLHTPEMYIIVPMYKCVHLLDGYLITFVPPNDLGGYGGPKRVLMASFSALYDPANHQVNRVTVVYPQSFAEI